MKPLLPGVVMSFDDHQYIEDWVETLALFERYSARITFFIHAPDKMSQQHWDGLHTLVSAGHAVGCHSMTHAKAIDYASEYGGIMQWLQDEVTPALDLLHGHGFAPVSSFGYPCNQNNAESNAALKSCFRHARYGVFLSEDRPRFVNLDEIFKPVDCIHEHFLLAAKSLDRLEDLSMIEQAAARAASRNEILFLLGHRIGFEEPEKNNRNLINRSTLEETLKIITSHGLEFYTFDDLPEVKESEK